VTESVKKFNRFDYLKEKAEELGVIVNNDNEGTDSDDERVTRIRELAKLISHKITSQKENGALSTRTSSANVYLNSEVIRHSGSELEGKVKVIYSECGAAFDKNGHSSTSLSKI